MGDKNFRLHEHIRPTRYRARIAPDLDRRTFAASGAVELTIDRGAREITVHGVDLVITSARVGGEVARVSSDHDSQTITFAFAREIGPGAATLELEWTGKLHADLRGFYMAGAVAVTQFEAADARRVFPCFDEPPFKAVWELSLVAPEGMTALSNGAPVREERDPGDPSKRVVHFAATPKMSSYLVALIVGPLVSSEEQVVRGAPLRTWAVAEKAGLTAFAQECASSVLPLLEDYFAHPYVFGKVDQVAIPDFEAGAMENSGCITFREIALLIDGDKAPLALRKRVAEIITHELAHQWFGNLVTMQWWDDLWLNEAFATWMAFKIVDAWRPGWRMWDDFERGKAGALHLDALETTHPIRAEVRNADEASENFDLITYEKGGAMLRMIEGYLGADTFREGIRLYMRRHAWGNTVADDLWRALAEASGQPTEALARAWIGRPGFPLVEVKRSGAKVTFSQRRFFADPERFRAADEAPWPVPLTLRWADDAGVHEARMLLDGKTGSMELPARGAVRFVCANRDATGFYRVKYDAEGIAELSRHQAELSPVERVQLITDAAALFRAGVGPLAALLDLLRAFADDPDYTVVDEVVANFDMVERRMAGEAEQAPLRQLVSSLLRPQLDKVGWEPAAGEADDRRLLRAAVVRGLALVARDAQVVGEAGARLLRAWSGDRAAVDPNLLDAVTVASARAGDHTLFDRLIARFGAEPDPAEKRRSLVSLASVEGAALVQRAIDMVMGDLVPLQDITTFAGTLLSNRAARDAAWEHLRSQWPALRKRLSPSLLRRMVESLREVGHRRAEVEAFFAAEAESLSTVPAAVSQTRERIRLDEDARRRAEPELRAWLQALGGRAAAT